MLPLDQILIGDSIDSLKALPAGSIDMIFADPPYNLQLPGTLRRPDSSKVEGVDDAWDKFDDMAAYDRFTKDWISEARRVLKKDGTMWVSGTYHNIFRLGTALQNQGFWMLNDIVWRKPNPMPNFRGRRFTNAHETLIWCARDQKSRYVFNYEMLKSANDDLQMRSDWLIPTSAGAERLKGADGKTLHPTQKPEALLARIILASTRPGDVILDPFFGTGTTGAVAKRLGRRWIGLDRDDAYAAAAAKRIAEVTTLADEDIALPAARREEPRIPFLRLLEAGLLAAGAKLVGADGKASARVKADGTIAGENASGAHRGSIHQVGAKLQGHPSCNGWTFWQIEIQGRLAPLDSLRQQLRSSGS